MPGLARRHPDHALHTCAALWPDGAACRICLKGSVFFKSSCRLKPWEQAGYPSALAVSAGDAIALRQTRRQTRRYNSGRKFGCPKSLEAIMSSRSLINVSWDNHK
jgi:hypothetical protein